MYVDESQEEFEMPEGYVTQSGFVRSLNHDVYRKILITQGLAGYTLVTKKKILFRIYYPQSIINQTTQLGVEVIYRVPSQDYEYAKYFLIPAGSFFIENLRPNGPSIGVVLDGNVFPGSYPLEIQVIFHALAGSTIIATDETPVMMFSTSGNIRILVKPLESITRTAPWGNKISSNISWGIDIFESLTRFASMLPIRDGIWHGLGNAPTDQGLAWEVGTPVDIWPAVCPSGNPPSKPDRDYPNFLVCSESEMWEFCLKEGRELNAAGIRVDTTVTYRPRDILKTPTAEIPGGKGSPDVDRDFRLATVVGGSYNGFETTASIMAQEVAHNFGCVSGFSPHTDGGWHSKDPDILEPAASTAFDFVLLRPYLGVPRGPVADVMGVNWGRGKDLVLFNEYDWEHLRKRLLAPPGITSEIKGEKNQYALKKMTDDLESSFADQKINVENYEKSLSSKPNLKWHLTRSGFQLLKKGQYDFDPTSIEMIFSNLEKLGIKEIYAPVYGKPFPVVVNPGGSSDIRCDIVESP